MTSISYPFLDECIQTAVLKNGLRIYGIPRRNSTKTFGMLAADFGSIDCRFTLDGKQYNVTPGIAHFLEHKMFEEKDGNALQKFTALGAQPNAFTGHTMTAYHFTCTEQLYACLEILLHFVTTPYFTDENVAKEKGIIGQEIDMLNDTPSWQAHVSVLEGLYAVHPMRISIAGSKQSIEPIDPSVLSLCHRAFYSPENLVLTVCGQFDLDRVAEIAERITPKQSAHIAERDYGSEPEKAAQYYIEKHMAVSRPMFMLGCKDTEADEPYVQQLAGELAVECICGKSSLLYDKLYQKGLIDQTFDLSYSTFRGGAYALFSGESSSPHTVREALEQEMHRIAAEGMDESIFSRMKKAVYGRYIRGTNDASEVCRMQIEACFSGAMCFDFAEVFQSITADDVVRRIRQWAADGMTSLAVITAEEGTA